MAFIYGNNFESLYETKTISTNFINDDMTKAENPFFQENKNRFVIFPIQHQ